MAAVTCGVILGDYNHATRLVRELGLVALVHRARACLLRYGHDDLTRAQGSSGAA
jgi:hypothetical protein